MSTSEYHGHLQGAHVYASRVETLDIVDGHDGRLSLNLAIPDVDLLADACKLIAGGPLPSGARTITVSLDSDAYVLTYRTTPGAMAEVEIASLSTPENRIRLVPEMADVLAAMIHEAVARQARS